MNEKISVKPLRPTHLHSKRSDIGNFNANIQNKLKLSVLNIFNVV